MNRIAIASSGAGDQAERLAAPIEAFFGGRVGLGHHAADIMV